MPRKFSKYSPVPIKVLNDTHLMLAELRAAGWDVKKCLAHLDISMTTYRNCCATEEWQDLLGEKKRAFIQRVVQEKLDDPARAAVREAVPIAVDAAVKIMKEGEDKEKNKAIKSILDTGVGAKIEHSRTVTGVQINITQNQQSDLELLEARMIEREQRASKTGLRTDRRVIDVSEVPDDA